MKKKAVFIAATGQHVGKTTTSLGIFAGLQQRFHHVGFIKPVGQQHRKVENDLLVDKDVVLFKEHFKLDEKYPMMSPVLFPSGFTRDYLDGKVSSESLEKKICNAFEHIADTNEFVLVEGTGHMGVGSIVNLNNAQVAKLLGIDVVIVASGGIGKAFDELALNINMCQSLGVTIRGVILNRVYDDKREMIIEYVTKALKSWGIPLIGCIPFSEFLDSPTMKDFENLFKAELISGERYRYRHYLNTRLMSTACVEHFMNMKIPKQLIITHSSREDVIDAILEKNRLNIKNGYDPDLAGGLVLTGKFPPTQRIIDKARNEEYPIIYAPVSSYDAMKMIAHHTGKIRKEDTRKVKEAIKVVQKHVNFDLLCQTVPIVHT